MAVYVYFVGKKNNKKMKKRWLNIFWMDIAHIVKSQGCNVQSQWKKWWQTATNISKNGDKPQPIFQAFPVLVLVTIRPYSLRQNVEKLQTLWFKNYKLRCRCQYFFLGDVDVYRWQNLQVNKGEKKSIFSAFAIFFFINLVQQKFLQWSWWR